MSLMDYITGYFSFIQILDTFTDVCSLSFISEMRGHTDDTEDIVYYCDPVL